MNVFAHVAVAARAGGDRSDRFLLGAALSDLATFGGFRLLGVSPDGDVRAGMAFHHRTDDAFHRHPWFRERNRAAAEALHVAGLGRGPARACAHVGVELLLDGALHHAEADRARFHRVLGATPALDDELGPLVPELRRGAWLTHLHELAAVRSLPPHGDPAAVASRLQRICARRPRLAFELTAVGAVADVLGTLAPGITATGTGFVDELAAEVAPTDRLG